MEIRSKVDLLTMVEDVAKRSETTKKYVGEWNNNQRVVVMRTYQEPVHKLVEDIEKIGTVNYIEKEVIEFLNEC